MDDQIPEKVTSNLPKQNRERKKHLITAIRKQVEFYFGDANLGHDRFLRRAIQEDPEGYVTVQVIADFNKLKQISNDLHLVVKAMKSSSLLQVSEDGSKVRRLLPLPPIQNTDARTIYVERLPPHADQDWLRELFGCCGIIDYISLPRYKNTKEIKGFAFIEYNTAEAAEKACQVLNSVHWKSNNSPIKKATTPSIGDSAQKDSSSKEKSIKRKRRKSSSSSEHFLKNEDYDKTTDAQSNDCESCSKRLKYQSDCGGVNGGISRKIDFDNETKGPVETSSSGDVKGKDTSSTSKDKNFKCKDEISVETSIHENTNLNASLQSETSENKCVNYDRSIERTTATDTCIAAGDNAENGCTDKKQSKRERKRRKKKNKAKEEKSIDAPPLYVISKKEWLRLKDMYKNLQRKETGILKSNMKQTSRANASVASSKDDADLGNGKLESKSDKPLSIPVTKGTILEVSGDVHNELSLKQRIKKELSSVASIAYVDVKDGENQGFLRLSSNSDVKSLMDRVSTESQSFTFSLKCLSESEEDAYHKKIIEDRMKKFSNKQTKKERGLDKVQIHRKLQASINRTNETKREHIHFGED